MSRSSLDDLESHEPHDRLLQNAYDHLKDSQDWETHIERFSRHIIPKYMFSIIIASLSLNVLLIVSSLGLWATTRSPLPPWPDTLYSPAQSAVEYEIVTFNSDFPEDHSGTTNFYGASPKAEEAWKNLMKPYLVRISGQEASQLSHPTSQISRDPDYYITSLDVYHQLHCLNDIRKMVRDFNSTKGGLGRLQTMHKFHCIDSIRQSLICNADLSLIHWYWSPQVGKNFPNATTTHICRKWSSIEEWAMDHRLDQDDYDPKAHIQ
ncbi:hypothetical protein FVEG_17652 [Fusarium verticillioides 7600]|uniref:Tat pathway signal sequence n=1 Tax=Gibberella moniliformis (strain M3125 / FGSC 7600) TaxID=334819 RepID=A0A139YBD2_GIBM7|nr:hypothetical protein FVEG_17652 [Fusarium verticillioides 7600]KYG13631.1 hypothetical protein FVEG_17652 [Fusarium verticillioides 7600]